jgi:hypothetical protein
MDGGSTFMASLDLGGLNPPSYFGVRLPITGKLEFRVEIDGVGDFKSAAVGAGAGSQWASVGGRLEMAADGQIYFVASATATTPGNLIQYIGSNAGFTNLRMQQGAEIVRFPLGSAAEFGDFLTGRSISAPVVTSVPPILKIDWLSEGEFTTTVTEYSFNNRNRMLTTTTTTQRYSTDEVNGTMPVGEPLRVSESKLQGLPRGYVPNPRCFLAGTPILMADGQEKPIEDIRPGDLVMSFDPSADQGRGALVPKPVSRTFQNITRSIIDLRGLHMTPGHVCLTDDGRFETIAEILLRDGILVEADGTPIRARTGAKIGSMEDIPVLIAYPDEKTGKEIFVRARAGIPCCLVRERDGTMRHRSLALMLRAYHQTLTPDGLIQSPDGSLGEATDWPEDSTPMDENYRRNWVIQTADGKPYVPEWILEVASEAREEQTVGATLRRITSPPSQRFTPRVVNNPTPPPRNRAERRTSFVGSSP